MRVWLLILSGVIAGYLAWTSTLFGGGRGVVDAGAVGDGGGASEKGGDASTGERGEGGNATKAGGVAFWARFAMDGLTGRYLYVTLRDAAGAKKKKRA